MLVSYGPLALRWTSLALALHERRGAGHGRPPALGAAARASANGAASYQPGATPQATERQPDTRAEGPFHNPAQSTSATPNWCAVPGWVAPLALGVVLCPWHGAVPNMGRCPMLVWHGPLALRWTLLALALRERHGSGHARPPALWGGRRWPAPTARPQTSLGQRPRQRNANPTRGPKARSITPRNPHPPHPTGMQRMDGSRRWRLGTCCARDMGRRPTWGVAPCWYRTGLWP
jgi:hypothetical protein